MAQLTDDCFAFGGKLMAIEEAVARELARPQFGASNDRLYAVARERVRSWGARKLHGETGWATPRQIRRAGRPLDHGQSAAVGHVHV